MKNMWKRFWSWFQRTPEAQDIVGEVIAKELEPKDPKKPQ